MIRTSTILLLLCLGTALRAQNLDKMNEAKRRETLLKIAKITVMEYGSDFYREYGQPEITHGNVSEATRRYFTEEQQVKYKNRSYYTVKYFYDKTLEDFFEDYCALVFIWGDTGRAVKIFFGNRFGLTTDKIDEPRKTSPNEARELFPPGKNNLLPHSIPQASACRSRINICQSY